MYASRLFMALRSLDVVGDTQTGATNAVYLNNEPDAISGTYPWQIYMVSPTTKIDTKADPATPPADTYNVSSEQFRMKRPITVAAGKVSISITRDCMADHF